MNHFKYFLITITLILSGCASAPKVNYEIPQSVYTREVINPLEVIHMAEWSEITNKIENLSDRAKNLALSELATKLATKSTWYINSGDRNRGIRLGLKGMVMSHMVKDFSDKTFHMLPLNYSTAIQDSKNAFMSLGLTNEVFNESLLNLAHAINAYDLIAKYTEEKRLLTLTPKENKPLVHSKDALEKYLKSVINGNPLSSYWCEESKVSISELFSPRSYKILGEKDPDQYIQGSYYNSYDVMIESSNQGGSPIIHTWDISLKYSELIFNRGKVDWCIFVLMK